MEKKRTQRIIGLLVVVALVVIALPLFFSKSDFATQHAANKDPAFSDQDAQTNVAAAEVTPQDSDLNASSVVPPPPATDPRPATVTAQNINSENADNNAKPVLPDPTTLTTPEQSTNTAPQQTAETASAPAADVAAATAATTAANSTIAEETTPAVQKPEQKTLSSASRKVKQAVMKVRNGKEKSAKSLRAQVTNKLKSPAWAIQMGNFKVKSNAVRLADKLRAAGYKAFIRDMKGSHSTRVYIGPEFKQASAIKLSSKIQQELKLQGIVVSYKPLEL